MNGAALYLGTVALLGVLICLAALFWQAAVVQQLQRELKGLRIELRAKDATQQCRQHAESARPQTKVRKHNGFYQQHEENKNWTTRTLRGKRQAARPKQRGSRKFPVLHLIPAAYSTNDMLDLTEVIWKKSTGQGHSFEHHGKSVVMKENGLYFIYSQVLFHDITFTMGQLMMRRIPSQENKTQILFKCVQSMSSWEPYAHNSCYSAGVYELEKEDVIQLLIPRFNATVDMSSHSTFMGMIKL
uniref:TNFSF13 n=1 Tax=Lepidosiren paradoxus TaxID=7883 RepID=A0A6G6CWK9_LEPPA|nr:TNFSF13 [Lepidosiren paradoxa]